MRIAFDVSPLAHPRTGIPVYLRGALAGMAAAGRGEHELVPFAPTSFAGRRAIPAALAGIPVEPRLLTLPFSHAVRTAWSRAGRPPLERFLGPVDALVHSEWMRPPQRAGVRATTIHDLVPLRFPEWTTARTRAMHGATYRAAARCDVVFANSRYTARDAAERLGLPEERLVVAPPGVSEHLSPDGERADLGRPYVLTVATVEPRKNLETLVAAHRLLGTGHALAVAGGRGWGERPDLDVPGVVRLGYVDDEALARLYRGASAFVLPSRFEGFGIPVVEAMACGVPVVASAHPSLDEASGDAALRADPESPEELAAAIERALGDPEPLVRRGLAHAAGFRWERTGRTMLDALEAAR